MQAPTWRDYQLEAIESALKGYDEGKRRMVVGLPTGAGKTVTAGGTLKRFLHPSQYGLFLVPFLDLVDQTYEEFLQFFYRPEQVGIVQGNRNDLGRHITIASKDTLDNPQRLQQYLDSIPGGCSLVIMDECHRGSLYNDQRLVDACLAPYGMYLGFSATPYRSDGQSLLIPFPDDFCYTKDIWDLILERHLTDITAIDVPLQIPHNFEEERTRMRLSVNESNLYRYAKILEEWKKEAEGKRTLVFAQDINDAFAFERYLTAAGYTAKVVTGKTPTRPVNERKIIYDQLRSKELTFLINFNVMTTGNNIKEIECIIIARDTENMGLLTQMVGRGLRPCPSIGKERLVLLNCTGNDITLIMFKHLFGSTKFKIPSVRAIIQEKKEKEEQQGQVFDQVQSLDMPVQANGTEFNPFIGGGWTFHDARKQWRKVWQHEGKEHTVIAQRFFDGGYQTYDVDEKGKETTICEQLLTKFDALKACNQYLTELKQGGVRGPDPRLLDEPISDADFAYLRQRKVPMRPRHVPWNKPMKQADYDHVKKVMKKRDFYVIQAFLKKHGAWINKDGRKIRFVEGEGAKEYGGSYRKEG